MTLNIRLSRFFIPLCLLAVMLSCSKRPSNVLSESKMVDLMVDMELAEAYSNNGSAMSSDDKMALGKQVMKAHGVSEETLDTTLAWYGRNLDAYAELFEKVDKEIMKRRKKYTEVPGMKQSETENLWTYGDHLIMSPLSGSDAFSFSLPNPDVKPGETLEFTFALANSVGMKGTLGVEYTDGHGEGLVSNISGKNSVNITLSTDTGRNVKRIFGTLQVKDKKNLPVYIDSLKLITQPFDSINYRNNKRNQKKFGPFVIKSKPKTVEKKDTITETPDSLSRNIPEPAPKSDSLKPIETPSPDNKKENDREGAVKSPQVSTPGSQPKPVNSQPKTVPQPKTGNPQSKPTRTDVDVLKKQS